MKAKIIDHRTLYCEEMELTVSGNTPSASLCRKILEINPTIPDDKLEVYRDNTLSYTISSIHKWSKRSISDNDNGLYLGKYNEFKFK